MATRKTDQTRFSDGIVVPLWKLETEARDNVNILFRNERAYLAATDSVTGRTATIVFTLRDLRDFGEMLAEAAEDYARTTNRVCRSCDMVVRNCICEMPDQMRRYIR